MIMKVRMMVKPLQENCSEWDYCFRPSLSWFQSGAVSSADADQWAEMRCNKSPIVHFGNEDVRK